MSRKKWWFFLLLPFLVGMGALSFTDTVQAKELTNVVTSLTLLDGNDNTLTPDSAGTYQLWQSTAYKLRAEFDLTAYNGNLANGDYFVFDLPAPLDVYTSELDLTDTQTGNTIASAVVTKNGTGAGGVVKVTLKNLEQYLASTGGDIIKDIKGNLAATFKIDTTIQNQTVLYNSPAFQTIVKQTYSTNVRGGTVAGFENFSKNGGQAVLGSWSSAKLAAINSQSSGNFYSSWRVRVNTGKQDLGSNIVVHDAVAIGTDYGVIQYIPETLKVYTTSMMLSNTSNISQLTDAVLLKEGVDYSVQWNSNYTTLDITIFNGTRQYWITYDTTTPNDGSIIANSVSVNKADGTKLTQRSNNTQTVATQPVTSLYSGTISASTAYRIKINKTDAFNFAPVAGAVYVITDPSGKTQEVTTGADGVVLSPAYDQSLVGQTFKIKEKTAPIGYELDEKEYTVVLGKSGNLLNLKDEPKPAKLTLTATKVLTGKTLTAGQFEFSLLDTEGNEVATAKNDANGEITFKNVLFKTSGTFTYSIVEKNAGQTLDGVTYDGNAYPVTVEVTADNGVLTGKVVSTGITFTNTYAATPTTARLTATKTLTGGQLAGNDFSFTLTGKEDGISETVKNTATGQIAFSEITYTKAGSYTYTIKEVAGSDKNINYDDMTVTATVTVVDNGKGQLQASIAYSDDTEFNNAIQTISVKGQKTWVNDNAKLRPETIFVELYADGVATGKYAETDSDDSYSFTGLPQYNADGPEIVYTVQEVNTPPGYTASYDGMNVTNTYSPEATQASLSVKKVLTGRTLQADEFDFVLKDQSGTTLQTVKNAADGSVTFAPISYTAAGTYTYTIVETPGTVGGVTYDASTVTATVTVVDNGTGQLTASVSYENDDQQFDNSYLATAATADLSSQKVLNGRDLQTGEFSFSLLDASGQVVETVNNAADGSISFSSLSFSSAGTYTYTIVENAGTLGGITYDTSVVTATITVTDNGKGQLEASVSYANDNQTFTNTYSTTAATASLSATKVLTGRATDLQAGEFSFDLVDADGNTIETVQNAADGSISFSALSFDKVGSYTYTIKEVAGTVGGVTYDTSVVTATVTVTDNGQGQLVATVAYENDDQQFDNTYAAASVTADLSATKVLTGRDLKAGEFSFSLTDQDGKVVQTVTNAADGSVRFDSLTFTKVGTYTYTITEDKGTAEGVTYDSSTVTATVTVTDDNQGHLVATVAYTNDDQTFENSYKPKDNTPSTSSDDTSSSTTSSSSDKKDNQQTVLPSTGSTTGGLVALVGLVLLAGLGYVLVKKEK